MVIEKRDFPLRGVQIYKKISKMFLFFKTNLLHNFILGRTSGPSSSGLEPVQFGSNLFLFWLKENRTTFKLVSSVVYLDQCLGAAHPKRWSKSIFSAFFVLKSGKNAKK